MKELSIEEKAKRYDEAIKRIENIKTGKCETIFMFTEGLFEYIFSELKENEDEKIKKWIRKELESKYVVDNIVNNEMADKAFAWLEKQGEQKMKTEPKDVIDVPLINIPFGAKDSELIGATYFIPKGFHAEIEDDKVIFKKGEQKSVWSEEDEERFVSCLQRLGTGNLEQPETINTIWLKSLKERMKK